MDNVTSIPNREATTELLDLLMSFRHITDVVLKNKSIRTFTSYAGVEIPDTSMLLGIYGDESDPDIPVVVVCLLSEKKEMVYVSIGVKEGEYVTNTQTLCNETDYVTVVPWDLGGSLVRSAIYKENGILHSVGLYIKNGVIELATKKMVIMEGLSPKEWEDTLAKGMFITNKNWVPKCGGPKVMIRSDGTTKIMCQVKNNFTFVFSNE